MSIHQATTDDFCTDLTALLPRMRRYALSLTRDADRADDLVQQTVVQSLAGRGSFRPGTNFSGWLFRIARNEFISGLRRLRPTVTLDDAEASSLSHEPRQDSGIVMREFKTAFRTLTGTQRQALLLTGLDGQSYESIAVRTGVSIGTVKSRVSRARATLRQRLGADERAPGRSPQRHPGGPAVAVI